MSAGAKGGLRWARLGKTMTAHLSEEQLRLYRARSLPAEDLLGASDHIAGCEICRARVATPDELHAGVEAFQAVLETEGVSTHLAYEEINSYADLQLIGEEVARVEAHIRDCESCATHLREIRILQRELKAAPSEPGRWRLAAELWKAARSWQGLALAGAAACALLVVLFIRQPAQQELNPRATREPVKRTESARQDVGEAAAIRDGSRVITVAAAGTVSGLEALPDRLRIDVRNALMAKRIEPPAVIAGLTGARGVLLGTSPDAPHLKLAGPLGTVVEAHQPLLRWQPITGAAYAVSVYNDRYDEVATSGWIRGADWRVKPALPRGARYSWQLKVRLHGDEFTVPAPPAPEARFQVLSQAGEADLAAAREAAGDSHLVLGVLYAQQGLLDEAAQELRQLRAQNPGSPAVAELLASVEALRKTRSGLL